MKVAIVDEDALYEDSPINFAKQIYLASQNTPARYIMKKPVYQFLKNTLSAYTFQGQEKEKTLGTLDVLYSVGLGGKSRKMLSKVAEDFDKMTNPRDISMKILTKLKEKGYELFLKSGSPEELAKIRLARLEKKGIKFADYCSFQLDCTQGVYTGKSRHIPMKDKLNGRSDIEWDKSVLIASHVPEEENGARVIPVYPDKKLYALANDRKWDIYPDYKELLEQVKAYRGEVRQSWSPLAKRRRGVLFADLNGVLTWRNVSLAHLEWLANEMPEDRELQQNFLSAYNTMCDFEAGNISTTYGPVMKIILERSYVPSLLGKQRENIIESAKRMVKCGLPLYPYAVALLESAGENRFKVLSSTTPMEILEAMKAESPLKFDYVEGLKAPVSEDGLYIGGTPEYPADDKGAVVEKMKSDRSLNLAMEDSMGMTNTIDDAGMLEKCTYKIGVNPDQQLREWLKKNGGYAWPRDEESFLSSLSI